MKLRSALLIATVLASGPAFAQVEHNIPMRPYAVDESYLTGLKWRNIGPNRGGRSIAAAGSMLGRTHSRPSSHLPDAAQNAFDDETARVAELKAQNSAQFTNQEGAVELQRQPDGHFYADVRINGNLIHMGKTSNASASCIAGAFS